MTRDADRFALVADIGGTNTRVALAEGLRVLPDTVRRYRNADYAGLETVLREFLAAEDDVDCWGACVAIAGPVRDGVGTMTNLDWRIDGATVARAAQAEVVSVLNDLQAQGFALEHLGTDALRPVIAGPEAGADATRLVVGAGTGFNAATVYHTRKGRLVPPAEAGHANMPVRSAADLRLAHFVETAHGFPGIEDVLAGRGVERIYAWLGHEAGDLREKRAADILAALQDGSDPRAEETARVYVRLFGSVVGNLALNTLPFGGIYLIGGVATAFAPYLERYGFADAFRDKGRFAGFMGNFGVSVVADDYAALTGCASHLEEWR
ncbi:glucokinase [Psychromarinibacter sp. C21-152]|uniref:Glucokinase n=1 Tax=Psychromarinibacter sediminicola TaxID=3033385 RepID=A0AAE3TCC6_9RHOB|nr:glucokinase [Psychromarinibacter sediminicola]MDF0603490.1 glucokinase [Psychromarinibacter sediminicola]